MSLVSFFIYLFIYLFIYIYFFEFLFKLRKKSMSQYRALSIQFLSDRNFRKKRTTSRGIHNFRNFLIENFSSIWFLFRNSITVQPHALLPVHTGRKKVVSYISDWLLIDHEVGFWVIKMPVKWKRDGRKHFTSDYRWNPNSTTRWTRCIYQPEVSPQTQHNFGISTFPWTSWILIKPSKG